MAGIINPYYMFGKGSVSLFGCSDKLPLENKKLAFIQYFKYIKPDKFTFYFMRTS
jgi:hypothetical protein